MSGYPPGPAHGLGITPVVVQRALRCRFILPCGTIIYGNI